MTCACGDHSDPTAALTADRTDDAMPSGRLGRRALLAGTAALGVGALLPAFGRPAAASAYPYVAQPTNPCNFGYDWPRPPAESHIRPIMFPVLEDPSLGKISWSDTYFAPRGGGGCRFHEGQDILGPRMTKLLACVDGTIADLRHRNENSLYIKGDDGWYYCYLHINNDDPGTTNNANQFQYAFAPGLKKGDRVTQGQHVAYLGDSGNAAGIPHLHFEIRRPTPNMWSAPAVNPKPSLDAARPAVLGGGGSPRPVDPTTFAPFASAAAFVAQQHRDFLGPTTQRSTGDAVARIANGTTDPDRFIAELATGPGSGDIVGPTLRLYQGYFLRHPDTAGVKYWIDAIRGGRGLDRASAQFAASPEFTARYGRLDDAGFVNLIYRNLFNRTPDPGGFNFWTTKLAQGADRGWFMRQLCETDEYVNTTKARTELLIVHIAMLQRSPSSNEFLYWQGWLGQNGRTLTDVARTLRTGPEYAARF